MSLGKYKAAQLILDEHRGDVERWFHDEHPAYLSVENNQALLWKLDGNGVEAKRIFEKVIEKYTLFYGENHPSTINSLINLGAVLKDLKENEEAIPVFERAIKGRKETEGEDSVNYAMAKAMAAGAYRDAGNFETADAYLKDAYVRVAMEHGEDNMTCSAILNSQGMLYKRQGKFERALDSYKRALEIRVKQFGEAHPESCATRHNIGEVYV